MSKMTRYAEAKSVKVDNWGVFFLQKLQNFFNKTDHCDLTLQFNDNSQLKVHRLVLSACTDYFNHLENVCEMYDDVLIMPMDLQADVIVPIVNFMYTGTLEFQYNMYDRLLKTATDMNMTVLLKLLEAHRQTSRIAKQPVLLNKQAPRPRTGATTTMYQGQQRAGVPVARGPMISGKPRLPMVGRQQQPPHSYGKAANAKPGPSRYVDEMGDGYDDSFDGMSYEGKPLLTADQVKKEEETSPFEKLRKGYTNANVVKRASGGSLTSPPAKKPNLDEVKEFTEAARMRSQLTTDDDDSPDYVDDDTHFNDDDDEDYQPPASVKAALAKQANASGGSSKQIVIKQESKSPGSGGGGGSGGSNVLKQITVKDDSGNVDHAKIISEVLKKYPHLVKKNKNIKLKIMQKPSSNAASASTSSTSTTSATKMEVRTATPLKQDQSMVRRATASIQNEPAAKASTSAVGGTASSSATPGTKPASSAPKTIDAKTMHALIAKGAENMTGPWLCLRCGINGRPISIPSYRAFRNHLVTKHKERIDVRICEHCGWRAQQRNPHLLYHLLTEHNIRQTVKFPKCDECDHIAMTDDDLQKHEEVVHARGGDLQQCIYCNKVFAKEMDLYDHMKEQHRERAIVEGVLEFTDDEEYQAEEEAATSAAKANDGKIKILSNITLPPAKTSGTARTLEPSSEAEAMSNVASGIATSLTLVGDNGVVLDDANFQNQFAIEAEMASVHGENATGAGGADGGESIPKLVTADGTELQLTQSQKDEIISQLQGSGGGNDVVMVLNEDNFSVGSTIQLGEGVQIVDATSQNIMLMYSQPGEGGSEHNDSQKSDAKADVTASEDDNSQASVALSEDKDASVDEKQTSLGEADESQESRRTDVSDKQHEEEEEYDGNTTADDVDMSGHETSETNETLQQAVKDELMDTEEHDEEAKAGDEASGKAGSAKDEDSEERQQSDKLRLISELEGDWSEDTAEEQPTAAVASETSKKTPSEKKPTVAPVAKPAPKQQDPAVKKPTTAVVAMKPDPAAGTKKKPSSETSPGGSVAERKKTGEEKAAATAAGKQLDTLLEDWNQDVKHEESFETESDADLEKAMEKVTNATKDEGKAKESKRDSTAQPQNDDDDGTAAAVVIKTEQATDDTSKKEESKKNGTKGAAEPPVRSKPDASELEDEEEEEDDDELDEEGKEKSSSKSKEVSSLLGEWDEDDDL